MNCTTVAIRSSQLGSLPIFFLLLDVVLQCNLRREEHFSFCGILGIGLGEDVSLLIQLFIPSFLDSFNSFRSFPSFPSVFLFYFVRFLISTIYRVSFISFISFISSISFISFIWVISSIAFISFILFHSFIRSFIYFPSLTQ